MENRQGRLELEKLYGKGCFMERAGIRKISPDEEKHFKKIIKGFRVLDRKMTYHHLKMKSQGGKVTTGNGANLAAYNHQWLHQQSPEIQAKINNQLRSFKYKIDCIRLSIESNGLNFDNIAAVEIDNLVNNDYLTIRAYDNTKEDYNKLYGHNTYQTRAQKKAEDRKLINQYYEDLYEDRE